MTLCDFREEHEKIMQALAQVVRERMAARRRTQVDWSGVSRIIVQKIQQGEKFSLPLFVKLSKQLSIDPCELLREVLKRRDALLASTKAK